MVTEHEVIINLGPKDLSSSEPPKAREGEEGERS